MKLANKHGNGIKAKLLEKASEIFAQKGYRDATIAEICESVGANVAAVNYYFGDKETLYIEAWRMAFQRSLETYPPDGGVASDASSEERLRGRILAFAQRFADPKSHELEIVSRERVLPTGFLTEVIRQSIEPLWRGFNGVIRELLGENAADREIMLCQTSIIAQCFDLMFRKCPRKMFAINRMKADQPAVQVNVEAIAEHITLFSLAGIREVRRRIENDKNVEKVGKVSSDSAKTKQRAI